MQKKLRMLICEDEEDTAKELEILFRDDYQVGIGYNVELCLKLLRARGELSDPYDRYAVAIVDLSFKGEPEPNTRGFEILNEVRNDPFLEPVVLTGTGDVEKAIEAHNLGAFRYVMKGAEARDGQASEKGSIAKLRKAVADATECWERLIQLDAALGRLTRAHPDDQEILPHARFVFEYIQRIRGRYPQSREPGETGPS